MAKTKSNRRANGEGSVYQRSDGRWVATYYEPTGKLKSCYGSTQAEALQKRADIRKQVARDEYAPPSKLKTEVWLMRWWEEYHRIKVRTSTASRTLGNIKNHLIPSLGTMPLQSLTTDRIQAMTNKLHESGYAPATINQILCDLNGAMQQAEDLNLIARNPVTKVKHPKHQPTEAEFLTPDEEARFLAALPDNTDGRIMRLILRYTGLRIGEVLALSWSDIRKDDNGNYQLSISHTSEQFYDYGSKKESKTACIISAPKTKSGIRCLPLSQEGMALLEQQRQAQIIDKKAAIKMGIGWPTNDLVFTSSNGQHKDRWNVGRSLRKVIEKAGIQEKHGGIGLHTLRHTFLTNLMHATGNPKLVSTFAGHSKVAFTMQVYAHNSMDDLRTGLQALEERRSAIGFY